MLLAGHETTATTITWALYYLARNEALQRRLQAEVDSALKQPGATTDAGALGAKVVDYLPLCKATMMETMRMRPTVAGVARRADRAFSFPDSDVVLPKGSLVLCSFYSQSLNRKVWGDDCEEFKIGECVMRGVRCLTDVRAFRASSRGRGRETRSIRVHAVWRRHQSVSRQTIRRVGGPAAAHATDAHVHRLAAAERARTWREARHHVEADQSARYIYAARLNETHHKIEHTQTQMIFEMFFCFAMCQIPQAQIELFPKQVIPATPRCIQSLTMMLGDVLVGLPTVIENNEGCLRLVGLLST
jgi:hypothetical protein